MREASTTLVPPAYGTIALYSYEYEYTLIRVTDTSTLLLRVLLYIHLPPASCHQLATTPALPCLAVMSDCTVPTGTRLKTGRNPARAGPAEKLYEYEYEYEYVQYGLQGLGTRTVQYSYSSTRMSVDYSYSYSYSILFYIFHNSGFAYSTTCTVLYRTKGH